MTEVPSHRAALVQYNTAWNAPIKPYAQRRLHEQGQDAASIINRAYYAMFYAALALLSTIGQETSKHSGMMALFDEHFIKPKILPKERGKFLHRAFDMRHMGDYEYQIERSREQALQVLESAARLVQTIEERLLKSS